MRARYQAFMCAVMTVQAHWRGMRERRSLYINRKLQRVIRIQAKYRGYVQRYRPKAFDPL